jgi:type I restriction enzyme R subunit
MVDAKASHRPETARPGLENCPLDPATDLSAYCAHAIEEYPTDSGPADYGLGVDGQLLGVVEANKVTVGPAGVLTQAERYSKGVADRSTG